MSRILAELCFSHYFLSLETHVSLFFSTRFNLFFSSGKVITLQKVSSTHWFPIRDIPRLPYPPFPSDIGTIQNPGGLFAWERRISSEVKSNRMCLSVVLRSYWLFVITLSVGLMHTQKHYERVCACDTSTYTSEMPYPANHMLAFGKCHSDRLSSCIYLKRLVCD